MHFYNNFLLFKTKIKIIKLISQKKISQKKKIK